MPESFGWFAQMPDHMMSSVVLPLRLNTELQVIWFQMSYTVVLNLLERCKGSPSKRMSSTGAHSLRWLCWSLSRVRRNKAIGRNAYRRLSGHAWAMEGMALRHLWDREALIS